MEDMSLMETESQVVSVVSEEEKTYLVLDKTIFYPQGGGQPFDTGVIESGDNIFKVTEVRFQDGIVKHYGIFEKGSLKVGGAVVARVDKERRQLHSRVHSAGHVLDMALKDLGFYWKPVKGFHFPEGSYVEYIASLDGLDAENLRSKIEERANEIIESVIEVKILFMEKEKMHEVCDFVPDYLPSGKPARVVLYGNFGIPCGGTHVSNLKEIGRLIIKKIKSEKGNIRVSYAVSEI